MESLKNKVVCITGASAGIGAACAAEFAKHGARLLLMARRLDRITSLCKHLTTTYGITAHPVRLDVQRAHEVQKVFESLPEPWRHIDILVNNAGLSRGLDKLHEGKIEDWDEMIDTNIKGLLYVTRAVLPSMVGRNNGHVINIGSIAGFQTYPRGNVYAATKHAVRGLTRSLKMDLLGTNVRVTSVDPGLVQTEFSLVRFRGDAARAVTPYQDTVPLKPEDVAEVVVFCATRPAHVTMTEVALMPTMQASTTMIHRNQPQP